MYNEAQKNDYLGYAHNKKRAKELFEKLAKKEEELNKDICMMNLDEIMECLLSMSTVYNAIIAKVDIGSYLEWCVIKDIIVGNCILSLTNMTIKSTYFREKEEFYISKEYYDDLILKLTQSPYGVYWTSFVMAMYEGISGDNFDNLIHLRLRDIDRKTNTIKLCNGATESVSTSLITMLVQTSQISEITVNFRKKLVSSLYTDSVWNFSMTDITEKKAKDTFGRWLRIMRDVFEEPRITKYSIERSGYFNIKLDQLFDGGMTKEELVDMCYSEKAKINSRYSEFFEDGDDNAGVKVDSMRKFIYSYRSFLNQI